MRSFPPWNAFKLNAELDTLPEGEITSQWGGGVGGGLNRGANQECFTFSTVREERVDPTNCWWPLFIANMKFLSESGQLGGWMDGWKDGWVKEVIGKAAGKGRMRRAEVNEKWNCFAWISGKAFLRGIWEFRWIGSSSSYHDEEHVDTFEWEFGI